MVVGDTLGGKGSLHVVIGDVGFDAPDNTREGGGFGSRGRGRVAPVTGRKGEWFTHVVRESLQLLAEVGSGGCDGGGAGGRDFEA